MAITLATRSSEKASYASPDASDPNAPATPQSVPSDVAIPVTSLQYRHLGQKALKRKASAENVDEDGAVDTMETPNKRIKLCLAHQRDMAEYPLDSGNVLSEEDRAPEPAVQQTSMLSIGVVDKRSQALQEQSDATQDLTTLEGAPAPVGSPVFSHRKSRRDKSSLDGVHRALAMINSLPEYTIGPALPSSVSSQEDKDLQAGHQDASSEEDWQVTRAINITPIRRRYPTSQSLWKKACVCRVRQVAMRYGGDAIRDAVEREAVQYSTGTPTPAQSEWEQFFLDSAECMGPKRLPCLSTFLAYSIRDNASAVLL
ncbi:hypothetical protein B0H21DRAFT_826570 [Amylocystis lapponica]|nr:hypothetical protein B0H21DRAFT_826570 [Amylocystis lapponica]